MISSLGVLVLNEYRASAQDKYFHIKIYPIHYRENIKLH